MWYHSEQKKIEILSIKLIKIKELAQITMKVIFPLKIDYQVDSISE